jgi:RNA polymerase sigma-70 factor (ECF subfamily)
MVLRKPIRKEAMREAADFDEFYAASSRRVLGQLYAMTGDLAAAEDAVADAFTRAWQRWASVRLTESPEAWVRTVAARTAVSSWRKTRNRLLAHGRAREPVDIAAPSPDHVVLIDALRKVPQKQRQALVLLYFADLSVAEIALEMRAAEGTVKSWLSRGRQALLVDLGRTSSMTGGEKP